VRPSTDWDAPFIGGAPELILYMVRVVPLISHPVHGVPGM
jgi:hypothetical protein